jgi:DNA modification methylase
LSVTILKGDCRNVLRGLPAESVQTIVTSPPYWMQRDYGVDGQIGREATLADHCDELVGVFAEARRVLRKDGTLWLNYGDSWASKGWKAHPTKGPPRTPANWSSERRGFDMPCTAHGKIKVKDLIGSPWAVAFALRDAGWWLRDCIIWYKLNPPPTSVKDRMCPAHEYIFLFSKSARYYFDHEAIEEPLAKSSIRRYAQSTLQTQEGGFTGARARSRKPSEAIKHLAASGKETRKRRSVWPIANPGFDDAHFATFPAELIEPCIKAGSRPGDTVLDPFIGAGTTGLVCDRLQRHCIGIELNPSSVEITERRIRDDAGMFAEVHS